MIDLVKNLDKYIPNVLLDTSPKFINFFRMYLDYLNSSESTVTETLDIDLIESKYIENYKHEYATDIPLANNWRSLVSADGEYYDDVRLLIKNMVQLNKSKGATPAIQFLFRCLFGEHIRVEYGRNGKYIESRPFDITFRFNTSGPTPESKYHSISNKVAFVNGDTTKQVMLFTYFNKGGEHHAWVLTSNILSDGDILHLLDSTAEIIIETTNQLVLDGWLPIKSKIDTTYYDERDQNLWLDMITTQDLEQTEPNDIDLSTETSDYQVDLMKTEVTLDSRVCTYDDTNIRWKDDNDFYVYDEVNPLVYRFFRREINGLDLIVPEDDNYTIHNTTEYALIFRDGFLSIDIKDLSRLNDSDEFSVSKQFRASAKVFPNTCEIVTNDYCLWLDCITHSDLHTEDLVDIDLMVINTIPIVDLGDKNSIGGVVDSDLWIDIYDITNDLHAENLENVDLFKNQTPYSVDLMLTNGTFDERSCYVANLVFTINKSGVKRVLINDTDFTNEFKTNQNSAPIPADHYICQEKYQLIQSEILRARKELLSSFTIFTRTTVPPAYYMDIIRNNIVPAGYKVIHITSIQDYHTPTGGKLEDSRFILRILESSVSDGDGVTFLEFDLNKYKYEYMTVSINNMCNITMADLDRSILQNAEIRNRKMNVIINGCTYDTEIRVNYGDMITNSHRTFENYISSINNTDIQPMSTMLTISDFDGITLDGVTEYIGDDLLYSIVSSNVDIGLYVSANIDGNDTSRTLIIDGGHAAPSITLIIADGGVA